MAGFIGALLSGGQKSVEFDGLWRSYFGGAPSKAGVAVTSDSALQCTTALACVQALACGVSMLPMDIYQRRDDGGRDVASGDPAWRYLADQPNDWQTWVEWTETAMIHAVLVGDHVSYINRPDPRGPIIELIPMVPGQVSVEQKSDYSLLYRLTFEGGQYVEVPRSSVFHLRGPSWNTYSGLDATRLAREAIGLSLATEEAHARLHSNGGRPGGILSTDTKLDRSQVDLLREQWQQTQGGIANTMKTAILSGGLKWTQVAMSGVDAQHIETRRFQIEEICRAFGVFPAMVGHSDKSSTFASAEQFFLANVIYSLGRWTRRFEERMTVDLLTREERRRGLYFKFSLQALMRGDAKARSEFYRVMIELGIMTRNEARAAEDMNKLPGLDEPLRPLNLATQAEADSQLADTVKALVADAMESKATYRGVDIDLTIPAGAIEEAKRALAWIDEGNEGGTEVGRSMARRIAAGGEATPAMVRKISVYFPRHEVDKQAEGFSPGEDGYPSPGRVAYGLWGGEAGKKWSASIVDRLNKIDDAA